MIAKMKNMAPPILNGLNRIIRPETSVPTPAINKMKIAGGTSKLNATKMMKTSATPITIHKYFKNAWFRQFLLQ